MKLTPYLFGCALSGVILSACPAFSLEKPKGGRYDRRITFIDYNPAQVVKLTGHYGYSTHIQFAKKEKVGHIAMGDADAWAVSPLDNHIFLKPVGDAAETNLTVITDKRVYNFELSAHEPKRGARDLQFQINFRYPKEEAAKQRKKEEEAEAKERMRRLPETGKRNWNYWMQGGEELAPESVYDDGRFTYVSFAGNGDMPAIYSAGEGDESEALVNTHIDPERPGTIAVHGVFKRLILRKGGFVTCLFNKSYNPAGVTSAGGTVHPNVRRALKEERE